VVLPGLALLEADAHFHAEQVERYRVRRSAAATTTERRFEDLKRTSRLADARLRQARALTAQPGTTDSLACAPKSDKVLNTAERRQLDHVTGLLDSSEAIVCLGQGLFQSGTRQCRGLAVLTDRRLLCVDRGARTCMTFELSLADIMSVRASVSEGVGAAKRGVIELVGAGLPTTVSRLDPWRRASDIATYIEEWQPTSTGADPEMRIRPTDWAGTEVPAHASGPARNSTLPASGRAVFDIAPAPGEAASRA
jgi:hypothetical protein